MSPPPAAIIIQQRGSTANGLALAFTSSVTVGDGLVSCVGHDNGVGTLTVSDTLGNIWTKTADIGWLGNAAAQTCAFTKTASGGADTVTWVDTTTPTPRSFGFSRVHNWESNKGVLDGSIVTLANATGTSGTGNITLGATLTSTGANELFFTSFTVTTGPMSATSGWTAFAGSVAGQQQWQNRAAAGSVTPTATDGQNSDTYSGIGFVLK